MGTQWPLNLSKLFLLVFGQPDTGGKAASAGSTDRQYTVP